LTKIPQANGTFFAALARFETVDLATIDLAQTVMELKG
jgi:hypothetical protein